MGKLTSVLLIAAGPVILGAQAPLPVGSLTFTPASKIADVDLKKLKGEAARFAWSPDSTEWYLQTMEGGYGAPTAVHHYSIDVQSGKIAKLQAPPEWFAPYWTAKSHKASPDVPGLEIALTSETRREQATAVPRGGGLARGSPTEEMGTPVEDVVKAVQGSQMVTTHTMKLNGETVGQFVGPVIVPGLTFAWAPRGFRAMAFTQVNSGKIVLMDPAGAKQEVPDTRHALLPAWSNDATRLAWLQKTGKHKYEVRVTKVQ